MKYKVGDIVKLRDDLEDEQEFDILAGTFVVDEDVLDLKNTPLKIVEYKNKHGFYIVEFEENKKGKICDEMIEGLWEECKPKLKLIDVLNMIAKGELKEGTKVKYKKTVFTYFRRFEDEELDLYENGGDNIRGFINRLSDLSIEVELKEPPCEHEWKDIETHRMGEGTIRRFRRCEKCGLEEVTEERNVGADKTIEELDILEIEDSQNIDNLGLANSIGDLNNAIREIQHKINEVIRVINKE